MLNGFQDWSWGTINKDNSSPVRSGSKSIRVSSSVNEAFSAYHSALDTFPYASLNFWAHGGTSGGQRLYAQALLNGSAVPGFSIPPLKAGQWQEITIPLSALGAANKTNFDRFWLQLQSGPSGAYYLDDIQFLPKPAPQQVNLTVRATNIISTIDSRMFGMNAAIWDAHFDHAETLKLLRESGVKTLRFPGGSISDQYHWALNRTLSNTWEWATSFKDFATVATNLQADVFITVNYGTGTPEEAAGWVRHSNITNKYAFKHWEVGNENYGTWETDANIHPHDPYTYAVRAAEYIRQMREADPTIKIGVVAVPGETAYQNGYTAHSATNSRTRKVVYGWTPVMLVTLKQLGVKPDFLVHHHYPEDTWMESDDLLLQSAIRWGQDAADLRQQIKDFYGNGGEDIELAVTENNSNSGKQGKQSTSLVNALYLADSMAQIMKTEFKAFVWWDLRNSRDTEGNMDPELYGWRSYGDLGMIDGLNGRYPTFYALKLMQYYAQPGDSVVQADSDYRLLSIYAAKNEKGGINLLLLNKSKTNPLHAILRMDHFSPAPNARQISYGIPQDEAQRLNSGNRDLSTNSIIIPEGEWTLEIPPLSIHVIQLTEAATAPSMKAYKISVGLGSVALELKGEPGKEYILERSTDLEQWTTFLTVRTDQTSGTWTAPLPEEGASGFFRASLHQQ
ncbi:MAG: alpha-L-arabinofuranosidase [Verrucomicrobiales bacterium]